MSRPFLAVFQASAARAPTRGLSNSERLGVLELGPGVRVVLQVVGESGEVAVHCETGRMLRVGLHCGDELHGLVVDGVVDEPVCEARHPGRQAAGHQAGERLRVRVEPPRDRLGREIDGAVVGVGLDDLLEPRAGRRPPLGRHQMFAGEVGDEVAHVVVAERIEHGDRDRRPFGADPLGVLRLAQPLAAAQRDLRARELGAHDVGCQEVRLDELAECAADLVLAARDDRGVRDRESERTAEQRGDGEPVGKRSDHAALGSSTHVAEPGQPLLQRERDDERDGHEQERAERDRLHAAQRAQSFLIGGRQQSHRRSRHDAILARRLRTGPSTGSGTQPVAQGPNLWLRDPSCGSGTQAVARGPKLWPRGAGAGSAGSRRGRDAE